MSGYKTLIVGIGFTVFGIALLVQGESEKGIENIGIGLAIIFGRMGIEKAVNPGKHKL